MAGDGFLAAEELRRMAIPTVGRSRAEFAEPFADGGIAGLALERLDIFEGEDRILGRLPAHGRRETFGAQWARFSRASVFPRSPPRSIRRGTRGASETSATGSRREWRGGRHGAATDDNFSGEAGAGEGGRAAGAAEGFGEDRMDGRPDPVRHRQFAKRR